MNDNNDGDLIPLKLLTEKQLKLLDDLSVAFYRAGTFLEISEDRTNEFIAAAENAGFNSSEAASLARHFNAVTKIVSELPQFKKEQYTQALKSKSEAPDLI